MNDLSYDELIEVQGIKLPLCKNIVTPRIERQMRLGNYEVGECDAARKFIRKGDRVLDLGAGIGLVASAVSKIEGVERIVSVEANPELLEVIRETHKINGIDTVELRHGIASRVAAEQVPFYLRGHFWSSSMEPDSRPYKEVVPITAFAMNDLIEEIDPTVIIADIEGGELEIFDGLTLDNVRTVIIELHPLVYGAEGQRKVLKFFDDLGFRAEDEYRSGSVWVFSRMPVKQVPRFLTRGPSSPVHNHDNPQFIIPTCMRNEGPFLLEWLAFHRSIGIQNFVVFSNDCSDGTDLLLDRLDELGVVTHLPNPAKAAKSTYFQPLAMKFAMDMPQVRRADYVIQTDVDEFINIKVGDGTVTDLLNAAGPFHVLSISELNFSSSGNWELKDGWLTEMFREHETDKPGHWQARRGVKSIIHGADNFETWPVHRPGIFAGSFDQLVWLDGSGNPVPEDFVVNHENGIDRRGRYDLVQLDHHPLRSAESYLMKQWRGSVADNRRSTDHHYYRKRSLGGNFYGHIDRLLPRARKEWDALISDKKLLDLHRASIDVHRERIRSIENEPAISEVRDWIRENYFADQGSD
ncbi:FkbM family methyltransferase [Ruegeria arenilitoris]|uniref:FkbM family methyltransferase n=1 Tax=Ruegeria arenilitoris TaxID=1173585 RepID=UPI00147A5EA3|nr:FkbM family methyltransferase [Ruegeria arenilitoris]